jgi:hypothetical protein
MFDITIGIAHDCGFMLVPDDMFIRYMLLSLIWAREAPQNRTRPTAGLPFMIVRRVKVYFTVTAS